MFTQQQKELSAELKRLTGVKKLGPLLNSASRQIAVTEFDGELAYVKPNPLNHLDIWDVFHSKLVYSFASAHTGRIYSVVGTSDYKFILSGSEDKSIAVWSLEEKKLAFRFQDAHEGPITSLVVSNDNKFLASASLDRSIALWDLENNRLVHRFENAHTDDIWSLAFTSDGKYIVSAGEDQIIAIWHINTKKNSCRIVEAHSKPINSIAVSPNNKYIVSCSEDETVSVWDFETSTLINKFEGDDSVSVSSIAVSQNSGYLFCGYKDGRFNIRNLEGKDTGKTYHTLHETANSPICQILPSSYVNYMATSSLNGDVVFWNLSSKEPTIEKIFQHGQTEFRGIRVTSDSKTIVSISKKTIFIWDFKERKLVQTFRLPNDAELLALALTPDDKQIVAATSDHMVGVWDLKHLKLLTNIEIPWTVWNLRKVSLAIAPGGDVVYYATPTENSISIVSLGEMSVVAKLDQQNVISLEVSRDSKYLAVGTEDNKIWIWELAEKRLYNHYEEPTQNWVLKVRFTQDDQLISSAWGGNISVWDYKNPSLKKPLYSADVGDTYPFIETAGNSIVWVGKDFNLKVVGLKVLAGEEEDKKPKGTKFTSRSIYSNLLAVTPENKHLIAGTSEGLEIWDLENLSFVAGCSDLSKHFGFHFDITSDSKYLVCSTIGNSIDIWHISSNTLVHRFEKTHKLPILSLSLSKNSHQNYFVSGSADGSIGIWDLHKRELVSRVENAHNSGIIGIIITQDNSKIVALSSDTITVWNLSERSKICSFSTESKSNFKKFDVSADSLYIATANSDGSISLFDIQEKSKIGNIADAHAQAVFSVLITSGNQHLISCSGDKSIAVWDFETKKLVKRINRAHTDTVTALALDSNQHLYSASESGSIRVWNTDSWNLIHNETHIHSQYVELLRVTNDNKHLISLSLDNTIGLLRLQEDPIVTKIHTKHTENIRCLVVSNDNAIFATASDTTIKIFDFYQREEIFEFKNAHSDWIKNLALTTGSKHEPKFLVSCSVDKTIAVWNIDTMKLHHRFDRVHQDEVNWFKLFPDNRTVATASGDGTIAILDIVRKQVITTIMDAHKASISRITTTTDWEYIVSAGSDFTIAIWKREHGDYVLVRRYKYPAPHFGYIQFLGVTTNNRHIVCSDLESVKIWEFEQEEDEPPKELESPLQRRMHTLNLSSDRRYLIASSAEDRSIVVWDLAQNLCLYHYEHSSLSAIGRIQFSQDLRYILYASQDENAVVFNKSSFFVNSREIQQFRIPILRAVDCYFNPDKYTPEDMKSAIKAFSECYLLPKGWNYLNFIVFMLPDITESMLEIAISKKVSLSFDVYSKTQLDYILDYTDDRTTEVQKFYAYFFKNISSFTNLHTLDPEKILLSVSENLERVYETQSEASFLNYLSSFSIKPEEYYKNFDKLPIEGEIKGGREKDFTQIDRLAYNEDEIKPLVTKKGKMTFYYKLIALPFSYSIYSEDSLKLVKIFKNTDELSFFQSQTVRDLIDLYWKKAQALLWVLFALNVIATAFFTACVLLRTSYPDVASELLLGTVIVNSILFILQILQLSVNPREFFSHWSNYVELAIIIIQFMNAGIYWTSSVTDLISISIILTTIIWYSKLLVHLRMINQLRNFIRMILEIVYDCLSFLAVIFTCVTAFTIAIYQAREADQTSDTGLWGVALEIYLFTIGYFDQTLYTGVQMPVFILATVVLPLILLNVLIALMWDTYERVRDNEIPMDAKERVSMVSEMVFKTIQLYRFWKLIKRPTHPPHKSYVLIVEPFRTIDEFSEDGDLVPGESTNIQSLGEQLSFGVYLIRKDVKSEIDSIKNEISAVRGELKSDIISIKGELSAISTWIKKNAK